MRYNNNVKYANFKGIPLGGLLGNASGEAKILAQKVGLQRQKLAQQAYAAKQQLGNKLGSLKNKLVGSGIKPQSGQPGALTGGAASQRALAISGGNNSVFQRNLAARQTLANQAQSAQAAKQARVTAQAKPKYDLSLGDDAKKQILQKQKVNNAVNQRVNQRVQTNAINARDDVSNRALGKQANPRTFVNNYQQGSLRQPPKSTTQQVAATNVNNNLKTSSATKTYNPQSFKSASDFLKDRQNQLQRYGGFKKTSKYIANF